MRAADARIGPRRCLLAGGRVTVDPVGSRGRGADHVTAPVGNTGQRPPTDDTWAPPSAPVTLAFGGDVQFENWLAEAVRADPHATLAPLAGLLGDADMAVVNLETAVTDRGTPAPKAYTFRAPELGLTALRSAGVDVVSIANNHGMDFGHQGLIDTQRSVRAAGLGLIGGGRDAAEAFRPHVATIHGRRVAVLGATQVLDAYATTAWAAGESTRACVCEGRGRRPAPADRRHTPRRCPR
jgi:poly-gamma-glutamate synthesis protein (capsule biosynthesis protein)